MYICTLARAQALRCSTRQAVGRRRSGAFVVLSYRSSHKDRDMKAVYADGLVNDEVTGKV